MTKRPWPRSWATRLLPETTATGRAPSASQTIAGCPVTVIVDQRVKADENPLAGGPRSTVIDDRLPVIETDEDAHRRRWRAWLYWGNLLQFLDTARATGTRSPTPT